MIAAIVLAAVLIAACTAIHYAALRFAAQSVSPERHPGHCLAVSVGVIVLAHTLEALIYAIGFWTAAELLRIGDLSSVGTEGGTGVVFMDYYYFSLVNYTTLGRGDLLPCGHLRFMTAMEAFHGFLLITASGAFILEVMGGKNPFAR